MEAPAATGFTHAATKSAGAWAAAIRAFVYFAPFVIDEITWALIVHGDELVLPRASEYRCI
mgnify:CR=1 FL=1